MVQKIKQIECSGRTPDDLLFLVAKQLLTGSQEILWTFTNQIHSKVIAGTFKGNHLDIINKMNDFYQNLVQTSDCEPAKGGKQDQDSKILQGMIAKLNDKVEKLQVAGLPNKSDGGNNGSGSEDKTCFKCKKKGHIAKDCPEKKKNGKERHLLAEWQLKAPTAGESQTKTVDDAQCKFCQKCLKGKGLWTTVKFLHSTGEHRNKKGNKNAQPVTGNLRVINDIPSEVHFYFCWQLQRVCIC